MRLISLPGERLRAPILERVFVTSIWEIHRYARTQDYLESFAIGEPEKYCYHKSVIHGNLLLQQGAEAIWNALTGLSAVTAYSNANARVGVSDNTTSESASDTELGGASSEYVAMDSGYPQLSGTGNVTVNFQSIFGSGNGNFAWESFGVDNGSMASLLFNRKRSTQGTKASGQVWTVKVSITAA